MKRLDRTLMGYWLLIAPVLVAMAVFFFYPLGRVLWMSVTVPAPGLENYTFIAGSRAVWRVFGTTFQIAILSTVLTLILAYVVAYVIAGIEGKWRRWMFLGVVVSLWISVLVRAFSWFALLRNDGLINQLLMAAGLIDRPLPMMWNNFSVTVGVVHAMLPLAILPLYSGMQSIDPRLVPAARGLGASRFAAFWRVYFPLTVPGLLGASILVFIYALGFYVTPALLGGGKRMMVAEYIKTQILDVVNWGVGSGIATLLLAFIALCLFTMSRLVDLGKVFGAK